MVEVGSGFFVPMAGLTYGGKRGQLSSRTARWSTAQAVHMAGPGGATAEAVTGAVPPSLKLRVRLQAPS